MTPPTMPLVVRPFINPQAWAVVTTEKPPQKICEVRETQKPYADLFAAAPDLYEALEDLLKAGDHDGPCDNADESGRVWPESGACQSHLAAYERRKSKALAALAKARGEKP